MAVDYVNYKINPYIQVKNTRVKTTASTNLQVISAVPANLWTAVLQNNSGSVRYVKIYNKATAPVPASDTPVASWNIPAGQTWTHELEGGLSCPIGIALAITGGVADTDTTATAVDDVHATFIYA